MDSCVRIEVRIEGEVAVVEEEKRNGAGVVCAHIHTHTNTHTIYTRCAIWEGPALILNPHILFNILDIILNIFGYNLVANLNLRIQT